MSNVTHTHIQTHLHPIVEIIVSRTNTLTVSLSIWVSSAKTGLNHFVLEDDLNILLSCLYFHSANITDLSHLPGLGSAGTQTRHLMNAKQAICQLRYISISYNFLSYLAFLSAFPYNTNATSETQM